MMKMCVGSIWGRTSPYAKKSPSWLKKSKKIKSSVGGIKKITYICTAISGRGGIGRRARLRI